MIKDYLNILTGLGNALDVLESFVYIKDRESRYVYANRHTLELLGCTAEELDSVKDSNFFQPDVVKVLREVDLRVLAGESTKEEIVIDDKKQGKRVFLEVKTPVYSETNPDFIVAILGISTDITYQKLLEEKALKLARIDILTGLANRVELDSVLGKEFERQKRFEHPLSIVMVDIDNFKKVNDNYGHLTGDKCLAQVAKILSDNARVVDTVGRWGGEEFLIICPETDLTGTLSLAEKMRVLMEESVFPGVKNLTGSFGVTSYVAGDTFETIISRADKALYQVKELGRNRVKELEKTEKQEFIATQFSDEAYD